MKTVKTYMVRKPSDISEVRDLPQKHAHQAKEVVIAETVHLSPAWYQADCQCPLDNYIFLSGKGEYNDDNQRHVVALECNGLTTLYVLSVLRLDCSFDGCKKRGLLPQARCRQVKRNRRMLPRQVLCPRRNR